MFIIMCFWILFSIESTVCEEVLIFGNIHLYLMVDYGIEIDFYDKVLMFGFKFLCYSVMGTCERQNIN